MIAISYSDFFNIIIVASLFTLGILWGRQVWRSSAHGWNLSESQLVRCKHCGITYIVPRSESVAPCPGCQELNKIRNKKASKRMSY